MRSTARISEARVLLADQRRKGRSIGLVPTMGNIHAGHLALLERCREECDFSVVTIFVNPLQFGPKEDYANYPRTLQRDRELLARHGCGLLLQPSVEEMYGGRDGSAPNASGATGAKAATRVHVPELSTRWCGASRPGHFDGVATIVAKLLNIVRPEVAYFGLKDYQQFLLIRKMAADLDMESRIAGVEILREDDGLAMSSRNAYLTPPQRRAAPALYRVLQAIAGEIRGGQQNFADAAARGKAQLTAAGFQPDYLEVCRAGDLRPAGGKDVELVILAAAFLGRTRLIDNLRLAIGPDSAA